MNNNRRPFDHEDGLAHAMFLGFNIERQVAFGGPVRFALTSPGREYGWVQYKPFGAPGDTPWQGCYLDFSSGKEERKRVFGASLSEALGHLAIATYPKLQRHLKEDAEHKAVLNSTPYTYSGNEDELPHSPTVMF